MREQQDAEQEKFAEMYGVGRWFKKVYKPAKEGRILEILGEEKGKMLKEQKECTDNDFNANDKREDDSYIGKKQQCVGGKSLKIVLVKCGLEGVGGLIDKRKLFEILN